MKRIHYDVCLYRDTSEEIVINVLATNEAEARELALQEVESNPDLIWNSTDYAGDTKIGSVSFGNGAKSKNVAPESNIDFVVNLMEHSNHGALAQFFILDAISKLAEYVSTVDPEKLNEVMKDNFVTATAWQGVARELSQKFKDRNSGVIS